MIIIMKMNIRMKKFITNHINLNQEQYTQENGKMKCGMGSEYKYGQMVQNMKDFGEKIKQMEKGDLLIVMVMFMKESGKMIKLKDLEYILIMMVLDMREIGMMISKMDLELKYGQIIVSMRENINRG
jgi:hypothetical protein